MRRSYDGRDCRDPFSLKIGILYFYLCSLRVEIDWKAVPVGERSLCCWTSFGPRSSLQESRRCCVQATGVGSWGYYSVGVWHHGDMETSPTPPLKFRKVQVGVEGGTGALFSGDQRPRNILRVFPTDCEDLRKIRRAWVHVGRPSGRVHSTSRCGTSCSPQRWR